MPPPLSKVVPVAVAGLLLLAATLSLLFPWMLPYHGVRAHLDSGWSCQQFTPQVYDAIQSKMRVLAIGCVAVAVLVYAKRETCRQVLRSAASSSRANVRDLVRFLSPRAIGRLDLAVLAALCVLGLALRFCFLFQPVRYDEASTFLSYSSKPIYVTLASCSVPNNHVLHSVLTCITCRLFGQEVWALRLLALVCGLLLIPASYAVARVFFSRAAALLSASLVASSSWLILYSVNARGYTLVALCALILFALAPYLLERRNWVAWCVFSVVAALGFFTNPTLWSTRETMSGGAPGRRSSLWWPGPDWPAGSFPLRPPS